MTDEHTVRPPAVAGLFYPADAAELEARVRAHLDLGSAVAEGVADPKAVIAPHAGYDYSGPIAGSAFAPLASTGVGDSGRVRRIVLIGPAHREPLRGLGLPGADAFETPLGNVAVDQELVGRVEALAQVTVSPFAHSLEHSLEVELPFLQLVLGEFTLLPLVVGDAEPDQVAEVLEAVWGGEETCVVVSSDLSHYLSYEAAERADRSTAERVLALDATLGPFDACGAHSVNGLLVCAANRGLRAELVDLRNSGDTAGDRSRVVGYGAFAFFEA